MKDMLSAYSLEAAFKNVNNLAQVYIGYSGGVDSHVLLHLCSLIPHLKNKITENCITWKKQQTYQI